MRILPHERPARHSTGLKPSPDGKTLNQVAREARINPQTLRSYMKRTAPHLTPEDAAQAWHKRPVKTAAKLREFGMTRSAVARFRWYHRGTDKAAWSDDEIIQHMIERRNKTKAEDSRQ
ncbi:hypothetical protein [Chromohalobacter sp. 296-RDG]|uniref:hypothetical protein n=1 Tax=Chromohalobacter sp. 296-RDG TaxID=2994062 RepID=UPI0024696513|nr:hypothetical protein [Chromohalobacter sp. 296-RDG]